MDSKNYFEYKVHAPPTTKNLIISSINRIRPCKISLITSNSVLGTTLVHINIQQEELLSHYAYQGVEVEFHDCNYFHVLKYKEREVFLFIGLIV